jgi:hypothetical protein
MHSWRSASPRWPPSRLETASSSAMDRLTLSRPRWPLERRSGTPATAEPEPGRDRDAPAAAASLDTSAWLFVCDAAMDSRSTFWPLKIRNPWVDDYRRVRAVRQRKLSEPDTVGPPRTCWGQWSVRSRQPTSCEPNWLGQASKDFIRPIDIGSTDLSRRSTVDDVPRNSGG